MEATGGDDPEYSYDVAFSFLAQDEGLATELSGLLEGPLTTFLYAERQDSIAGTDGEETFNRIFGSEARAVVVLYRSGWGDSPFTRIEQTAIRNRAYDVGYDFTIFVSVDGSPLPPWVPKTRLWVGLDRWGVEAAAAVIESRVQELGGTPRPEGPADKARRLARELEAAEARKTFLNSEIGVQASRAEFGRLIEILELATSKEENGGGHFRFDSSATDLVVASSGFSITIHWRPFYTNSLSDSRMILTVWKGPVSIRGRNFAGRSQELSETSLDFDQDRGGRVGWTERSGKKRFFTTDQLANHVIELLVERVRRHSSR